MLTNLWILARGLIQGRSAPLYFVVKVGREKAPLGSRIRLDDVEGDALYLVKDTYGWRVATPTEAYATLALGEPDAED